MIDFTVSDDFDKFMKDVELYGLLKVEEEFSKKFLKEDLIYMTKETLKGVLVYFSFTDLMKYSIFILGIL